MAKAPGRVNRQKTQGYYGNRSPQTSELERQTQELERTTNETILAIEDNPPHLLFQFEGKPYANEDPMNILLRLGSGPTNRIRLNGTADKGEEVVFEEEGWFRVEVNGGCVLTKGAELAFIKYYLNDAFAGSFIARAVPTDVTIPVGTDITEEINISVASINQYPFSGSSLLKANLRDRLTFKAAIWPFEEFTMIPLNGEPWLTRVSVSWVAAAEASP